MSLDLVSWQPSSRFVPDAAGHLPQVQRHWLPISVPCSWNLLLSPLLERQKPSTSPVCAECKEDGSCAPCRVLLHSCSGSDPTAAPTQTLVSGILLTSLGFHTGVGICPNNTSCSLGQAQSSGTYQLTGLWAAGSGYQ